MMKTKIISIFLFIGFVIFNLFYYIDLSQESDNNSVVNVKNAQANPEEPPVLWHKTTGDCSITIEGETGVPIKVFGVTYLIPANGKLTLTFSDVAVDCASGGTKQCQYVSCAQFWSGSGA